MAGLLDFLASPEAATGIGLLAASGPRFDGAGFGQRLQEGLSYGQKQREEEMRRKQVLAAMEMQAMQMQEMKQKIAQEQELRALAQRFKTPAQQGLAPLQGDAQSGILPSAGRAAVPAGFDYQGYAGAMAGVDPMKALQLQQALQKETQINKLDVKDFTPASVAKFSMTKNYGDLVRMDKLHFGDTGGAIKGMDPFSGREVSSNEKTQSPDNFATTTEQARSRNQTNALGWANYGLAKDKAGREADLMLADSGGPSQAAFTKQYGKPSAGYRWKADGSQEFIPGGPADQKAQMKTAGEGTVDSVVADIRSRFDNLSKGGGVTDTSSGPVGNLGAGIASSGPGQFAGRMFGTQNQSERNQILMARPMLLQAIMKATGMSAKQMDSNAELKLYLATATDPTLDLQANMAALDRIEKLYGSGNTGNVQKAVPKSAPMTFDSKPPAHQYKGKFATGPDGKRYQSDGLMWKEVQ